MRCSSPFVAITVGIAIVGCQTAAITREPIAIDAVLPVAEQRIERNYTIGQRHTASVGEAIVRLKEYSTIRQLSAMAPVEPFTFAPGFPMSFKVGDIYPVRGTVQRGGKAYNVVWHTSEHYGVLVSQDGLVQALPVSTSTLYEGYTLTPPNARMKLIYDETVDSSKTFTNFMLIYNGRNADALLFTYQEFGTDGAPRPVARQALSYQAQQPRFGFRDVRIAVHRATNEEIEYTVLQDHTTREPK